MGRRVRLLLFERRNSVSALAVARETIDAVAETIVTALAPTVEDYEAAKRAVRAAIEAMTAAT
jgi:hypothetical protein